MATAIDWNTFSTNKSYNAKPLNSERFYVNGRLQIVFDMDTGYMDDFVTLLFLLGHPLVNLKAITIVPGTPDQIGFIRHVLALFHRVDLPLGVFDMNAKPAFSRFDDKLYYETDIKESREASDACDILLTHCDEHTILVCGGPLSNVSKAIQTGKFRLGRLVIQGGFAGDNIVPPEKRINKLNGLLTSTAFNLDSDVKSALVVLQDRTIEEKLFVSKNVCRRVHYTRDTHKQLEPIKDKSLSLKEIYRVMSIYLRPTGIYGEVFHDPLTACCAIDPTIGEWQDVELYFDEKTKEWGSRIVEHPNIKIIVDYNHAKFLNTLFAY
jgi:pyrimidine-specific ribonucleoside hydrolase